MFLGGASLAANAQDVRFPFFSKCTRPVIGIKLDLPPMRIDAPAKVFTK